MTKALEGTGVKYTGIEVQTIGAALNSVNDEEIQRSPSEGDLIPEDVRSKITGNQVQGNHERIILLYDRIGPNGVNRHAVFCWLLSVDHVSGTREYLCQDDDAQG